MCKGDSKYRCVGMRLGGLLAALSGNSKLYHKILPFDIERNCTSPPNLTTDPNSEVTRVVIPIWKSWSETGFEV